MPEPLTASDFFAHHSPFGAFASFTLGRYSRRGGFGLELSAPAEQDVYIAVARPGIGVRALPFYEGAHGREAEAYTGASPSVTDAPQTSWAAVSPAAIRREMGWASDSWQADDLTFTLFTPFGPIADLSELGDVEVRRCLCPAIFAEFTIDNRAFDVEAYGFFGIGATDPLRPLSDNGSGLCGIARNNSYGFAVVPDLSGGAREVLTWSLLEAVATAQNGAAVPVERLSNRGGVLLAVQPGEKRTFRLVIGFYRDGMATTGIQTSYLYSRLFGDLDSVLEYGTAHCDHYIAMARERDAELDSAPLTADRKLLIAHSTHSYHGSTMLLHDSRGSLPRSMFSATPSIHRPLWVVNEGEYRMMNTFDLTVDHAFFELTYHPWTLRNTLDLFIHRYSYVEDVQDATAADRPRFRGGLSFTHDMGVANQFSPAHFSSYERPDLDGCFSYMTQEQLCNWCLCAGLYGLPTVFSDGDVLWLAARRTTLHACLESLQRRDGPEHLRNGVMSLDSVRCGIGQEITTYDSLDPSLGQSRANAYLAVKTWASYLALSRCFDTLGEEDKAAEAEEQAARAAATIALQWNEDGEYFPAVFEEESAGYTSRILPVIEGLVYPFVWGDEDAVSPFGRYGQLIGQLRRHLKAALVPGVCIDSVSGGLKISSSSENTWMSKLFLCQFVAERVLGLNLLPEFDSAHLGWQCKGNSRNFAFTDQVRSTDGYDLGSRFYPRGVTSVLWML